MKKISESTIRRLSRYYRSLGHLIEKNMETVSSDQLAEMDGITSAQVRKDLSFFGTFGKRGLGYNTKRLQQQVGEILGLNHTWRVCVAGAGNIGRALVKYEEFKRQGFQICLIVDSDPAKIGDKIAQLSVQDINKLSELIRKERITIGIIAVSSGAAQEVSDKLVDAGIKAILNFAPVSIKVPEDVKVKSENTAIEIEALSYHLSNK